MQVDPKLFAHFVAVAEALSFGKAAVKLNVSQPWLSKQVRKLEHQLGFSLFERSTRHVALTHEGELILPEAERAVRQMEKAIELARSIYRDKESRLNLGVALYALFVDARTSLVDHFIQRYPRVSVETHMAPTQELLNNVRDGVHDAAFAMQPGNAAQLPGLRSISIRSGGIDILTPQDDPLLDIPELTNSDLSGREMAVFSRRANPEMFHIVFSRFEPFGVSFREFSDQSFFRHLKRDGLVTAIPSWQPSPVAGLARRSLGDLNSDLDLRLFRRRGPVSQELDLFWSMASACSDVLHVNA